jgi:hypothetical protein
VAEHIRHPSSKRIDAGENPAGSAILLPDGVKAARRPVKPLVAVCKDLGASPSLAANFTEGRQIQAGCACLEIVNATFCPFCVSFSIIRFTFVINGLRRIWLLQ